MLVAQEMERTRALVEELVRLVAVNEELQAEETKCHILGSNLQQLRVATVTPDKGGKQQQEQEQLRRARGAVAVLKAQNERAEGDIGANSGALDSLRLRCADGRDAVKRLEYDVNVVEKECRKLGKEYQKVLSIQIPQFPSGALEEGDLGPVMDRSQVIYTELKELQLENAQRLRSAEASLIPPQPNTKEVSIEAKRVLSNNSPEGSSSGASSGADDSAASGSSLSVNDTSNAVPSTVEARSKATSVSKSVRFRDDLAANGRQEEEEIPDNNSDTGLSSLHSCSGDEGAAAASAASTAKALAAALEAGDPGAFTLDFGTLV